MTQRCVKCGSMNSDKMKSCGKCGGPLEHVKSVTTTKTSRSWDEVGVECPNCGSPMEEGVLETGKGAVWVTGHGEELIGILSFEGYKCPGCGHMSLRG